MSISAHLKRPGILAAAFIAILAFVVGGAPTASSSPGQVVRVDVTGSVFTCEDGSYTVTTGDAIFLFHESTDQSGGTHVTGTVAPRNVTLSFSGDDNTYRLAGAAWFGGNFTDAQADFTDTEFFQILGASGGVVDNVSIVSHFTVTANGDIAVEFEKNTGTCQPPEDEG